jgi:hypothetical protein
MATPQKNGRERADDLKRSIDEFQKWCDEEEKKLQGQKENCNTRIKADAKEKNVDKKMSRDERTVVNNEFDKVVEIIKMIADARRALKIWSNQPCIQQVLTGKLQFLKEILTEMQSPDTAQSFRQFKGLKELFAEVNVCPAYLLEALPRHIYARLGSESFEKDVFEALQQFASLQQHSGDSGGGAARLWCLYVIWQLRRYIHTDQKITVWHDKLRNSVQHFQVRVAGFTVTAYNMNDKSRKRDWNLCIPTGDLQNALAKLKALRLMKDYLVVDTIPDAEVPASDARTSWREP